jgi:hypothetical protein
MANKVFFIFFPKLKTSHLKTMLVQWLRNVEETSFMEGLNELQGLCKK